MSENVAIGLQQSEREYIDRSLLGTYTDICASEEGFAPSRDAFLHGAAIDWNPALLRAFRSTHGTHIVSWLSHCYQRFLARGKGCEESTPGYRRYDANRSPKKVPSDAIEQLADGGMRVQTHSGAIFIGVAPPHSDISLGDGVVVPLMKREMKEAGVPRLERFAGGVYTPLQSLPFVDATTYGGVEIVRLSDYGVRIFSDGEYLGDVSTTARFTQQIREISSPTQFQQAWDAHLELLLQKAHDLVMMDERATRRPPDREAILLAYREIMHIVEAQRAFVSHPLLGHAWVSSLIRPQIAKINNGVNSVALIPFFLEGAEGNTEKALHMAAHGLRSLFEPFDHLLRTYHYVRELHPWITFDIPEELPEEIWNGDFSESLQVRRALDAIVDAASRAGRSQHAQARLTVSWDAERHHIHIEDTSLGFSALNALDPQGSESVWGSDRNRTQVLPLLVDVRHSDGRVASLSLDISRATTQPSPPPEPVVIPYTGRFAGFVDDIRVPELRDRFERVIGQAWTGQTAEVQERSVELLLLYSDGVDAGTDQLTPQMYQGAFNATAAGLPATIMRARIPAIPY